MSNDMLPRRGAIAVCSKGSIGIITSDEPVEVTYPDGSKSMAWVGLHLTDKIAKIGEPWSSRTPTVLLYLSANEIEFTDNLKPPMN